MTDMPMDISNTHFKYGKFCRTLSHKIVFALALELLNAIY
jgi:hypothetical protein